MNGPELFREAQAELFEGGCEYGCPHAGCAHEMAHLARAQAYATLALAAVTALAGASRYGLSVPSDWEDWYRAVTGQPGNEEAAS